MPPEHLIVKLVKIMCAKCAMNDEGLAVDILGGDRRRFFPHQGIRINGVHATKPYSVLAYIGNHVEAIEVLFSYTENKKPVLGRLLHERMMISFDNKRVYKISDEMIQEHGKESGDHHPKPPPTPLIKIEPPEVEGVSRPEESAPLQFAERLAQPTARVQHDLYPPQSPSLRSTMAVTAVPRSQRPPVSSYVGYFDDPEHLHLGVVALVTEFRIGAPFSFVDFERVMIEDVLPPCIGVPQIQSCVVRFLNNNYMRRLNPGGNPVRYALTREAETFAAAEAKSHLANGKPPKTEAGRAIGPTKADPAKSVTSQPVKAQGALDEIKQLKETEKQYQSLVASLAAKKVTLTQMGAPAFVSEKANLEGEMDSLNNRLIAIGVRLQEIEKAAEIARGVEVEIAELQRKIQDPDLVHGHKQFVEMRELLTSR